MSRPLAAALALAAAGASLAAPEAPWRTEFDAICARTQDAMSLPDDELRELVARSDRLLPALERLPETERKVFTRRLRACRALYAFVLESRGKGPG